MPRTVLNPYQQAISINSAQIDRIVLKLADDLGIVYLSEFKIAIVQAAAIASGNTLKSAKTNTVLNSPSRGVFMRNVTANDSWRFIQNGRKKGKKLPVRKVGKTFEPLPEILAWFKTMNIPKKAWFPILLAIKRRGIKPRKVQNVMMRDSKPLLYKKLANAVKSIVDVITNGINTNGTTPTP